MKHLFTLILFVGFSLQLSAQSGWTQPKGEGYFKLSQDILRAGSFFNPDGEVIDITTTSVYSTNIYAEYGIIPGLTGILKVPALVKSTINEVKSNVDTVVIPGDEFTGLGDVRLGLKYGFFQDRAIVMSVSGELKMPSGKNVGGMSELLQTGDGAWGFTGLVAASHSFYPTPIYVSLYAGYQWRGTADLDYSTGTEMVDYSDAARWGAEFGWLPSEHWQVALKLNNVIALDNGNGAGITGGSSIFGNRISYFSITPEVAYLLDNGIGFSFGIGTALSAKNILAAPNFNVGVVWVMK